MRVPITQLAGRLAGNWGLDPEIVFLNHGSFGACPKYVMEKQGGLRRRMELQPVEFLDREFYDRMRQAREALAEFVGAGAEDLAFVSNASSGVNTVLRSLEFSEGDELLVTDHEYNACKNALAYVADRSGARLVIVHLPFPVGGEEEVITAILEKVTEKTRLALIDHITSPTALVLPIKRIVSELAERGVDTLVDGAHAPGQVPLNISEIGAAYYTANCHKWLCAPKGSALLHVRKDRQDGIHPLTISHGYNAGGLDMTRFRMEFDWTGTDDPTPFLCIPESIRFLESLFEGGWPAIMARNRNLAIEARERLCSQLNQQPACPDSMVGSMASVFLPNDPGPRVMQLPWTDPLQRELMARFNIEANIVSWPAHPKRLLRISAQLYNSAAQFAYLADSLAACLGA